MLIKKGGDIISKKLEKMTTAELKKEIHSYLQRIDDGKTLRRLIVLLELADQKR